MTSKVQPPAAWQTRVSVDDVLADSGPAAVASERGDADFHSIYLW